jgi:hypothetical protein
MTDNTLSIDRVKRRRRSKSRRRKLARGAHIIRRRTSAGVRCILVRPGKPAKFVKCR